MTIEQVAVLLVAGAAVAVTAIHLLTRFTNIYEATSPYDWDQEFEIDWPERTSDASPQDAA